MMVPFCELRRESERRRDELEAAAGRVMKAGQYILGPELEALEREFAAFLNVPYAAGVASGTDALALGIEAAGLVLPGRDGEVITSALSAAFTALAIWRAGCIPRFADVEPETLQIDPLQIEPWIGERTRAILPVHLYGHAADMRGILDLAGKHRLAVIEDACQAHGSMLDGNRLGTFGCAAGFSFYPTKNLGALGDAGMVVTHDPEICRKVKSLRHGGQSAAYVHELLGGNSRLDELQAAILRSRLPRLESRNEARRRIAGRYDEAFADLDLRMLPVPPRQLPNRHLYPVRTARRDELRAFLHSHGVETLVHYPLPLPFQPAFGQFVLPSQEFPVAGRAAAELLSLPCYPELTEEEIRHTIRTVRLFHCR